MFRTLRLGIILGIFIIIPIAARSQTVAYVGPHLGIQKSPDAQDANYLVGATVRLRLMPVLGVEGDVGYRQQKYGSDVVTLKEWPITVTGLLYPLPVVYGGLGAGWYSTTFDYSDTYNQAGYEDETRRNFGWHLAAGVELPASPKIKVFGDVRYVFLDYKFKELPGAVLDGAKANFYSINIGLLFHL